VTADVDSYKYPGLDVLRNKVGIKDAEILARFEDRAVSIRSLELEKNPIAGNYDLSHLRAIHRHLFRDVYAWAGDLRTVEIGKGGNWFAPVETPAHTLKTWGDKLFADLARDNYLRDRSKADFADGLAHHFSELNYAHFFREGNGRATRVFMQDVARQAGFTLEYQKLDRDEWIYASRASYAGDLQPVRELFDRVVVPTRALEFEHNPQSAVKQYPELQGAAQTLQMAQAYSTKFVSKEFRAAFINSVRERIQATLRGGDLIPTPKSDDKSKELPGRER